MLLAGSGASVVPAVGVDAQVVLREDEVPVLQEALVLAAGQVVRGAPLQAAVEVQLAARPARPASARPARSSPSAGTATIRSRGTPTDSQASIASSSGPRPSSSSPSKTVIQMSSGSKPKPVQRQLPRHLDGLLLEVVADREVAEHLEERQVARGVADVLDVGRAKALLDGRQARVRRLLLAAEVRHERVHARRRQQHGRVVGGRHERRRGQPLVVAAPRSSAGTSRGSRRSSCPSSAIVAHPTIASPREEDRGLPRRGAVERLVEVDLVAVEAAAQRRRAVAQAHGVGLGAVQPQAAHARPCCVAAASRGPTVTVLARASVARTYSGSRGRDAEALALADREAVVAVVAAERRAPPRSTMSPGRSRMPPWRARKVARPVPARKQRSCESGLRATSRPACSASARTCGLRVVAEREAQPLRAPRATSAASM